MEGDDGFGPSLTFSSLVLQAVPNAALCPRAALFWPMCVCMDVCASTKELPATEAQVEVEGLEGCLSVPVSSRRCWSSTALSIR